MAKDTGIFKQLVVGQIAAFGWNQVSLWSSCCNPTNQPSIISERQKFLDKLCWDIKWWLIGLIWVDMIHKEMPRGSQVYMPHIYGDTSIIWVLGCDQGMEFSPTSQMADGSINTSTSEPSVGFGGSVARMAPQPSLLCIYSKHYSQAAFYRYCLINTHL